MGTAIVTGPLSIDMSDEQASWYLFWPQLVLSLGWSSILWIFSFGWIAPGTCDLTSQGIPVRRTELSSDEIQALSKELIPPGVAFNSIAENLKLCDETRLSGWSLQHFRQGYQPEQVVVRMFLERTPSLWIASICPQALIMFLLFQVEIDLQALVSSYGYFDPRRTSRFLLSIQLLKRWLQDVVYPEEAWPAITLGLPFEDVEARNFQGFLRAQSTNYPEHVEEEAFSDRQMEIRGPRMLDLQDVYNACPGMHFIDKPFINIVSLSDGNVSSVIVEGPIPVSMALLGNQLSNYFQARGVAWLSGAKFIANAGHATGETFVKYLPRKVREPSFGASYLSLQKSCAGCSEWRHWRYPHQCVGPWSHVLHHARSNIRSALRQSGVEDRARALLRPHDVVIHIRCYPHFDRSSPMVAFSIYDSLPDEFGKARDLRFMIVAGPLGPECSAAVHALATYLQEQYSQSSIVRRFTSTNESGRMTEDLVGAAGGDPLIEEDFALLVFAPVLFRNPGTFSLWAALARSDLVVSAMDPFLSEMDFGPAWHWVQAPLLVQTAVEQHSFIFSQTEPWIHWLRTH